MTMLAGSVSVSDAGAVTKSGLAEAIYDQMVATFFPSPTGIPDGPLGVPIKRGQAKFANAMGAALVNYITGNAVARIAAGQGGLQKTPSPNNANTPTVGPSTAQDIAIV